ncbi:hypothetical protein NQ318_017902 [Aromia moschata]|uniref:Fibronectin type-III domain-containing protein n=1 Tax=Aromia moschata TaxID=1265417 RepID=A0AAV8YCX8_9CUCU|nr:hypothetical protein NQ318_017902 [Aromia moschata]
MNIVTPPPSDANLALDDVQYVPNGRHVELRWSLEEQWASCAQRYRVVILNEDTSVASDLYTTSTSVTLINLIPCGSYMFTVRALFTLEEEGPVSVVRHVVDPAATTRPTLESFTLGTNSIALTMQLQALAQNRCPIYNVEVKSPSFTATYLVTDQNSRTSFPLSITGLQPNTMYYVQISANNTVGATSPFQAAFQTLESS